MEFVFELILTALVAVSLSLLVAKLVSMVSSVDSGSSGLECTSESEIDEGTIMDELQFHQKLERQWLESEKKVEVGEEVLEEVDQYQGESVQDEDIVGSDNRNEGTEEVCNQLSVEVMEEDEEEVKKGENTVVELQGKSSEEETTADREESKANSSSEGINRTKEFEENVDDVFVEKIGEVNSVGIESKAVYEEKNRELDIEDDDWEGIERTELEKVFMAAAKYVEESIDEEGLAGIGSDVQMKLYGLHKIATEGTCLEPQPMALKVSARSKWNAWQKLGNMSPEQAMEQYIALLSDMVSGWMGESYASTGKNKLESAEGTSYVLAPLINPSSEHKTTANESVFSANND